jgi:Chaperone of endosialidase
MSTISTIANYGGKQPNNTTYVKQFVTSFNNISTWVYDKVSVPGKKVITPSDSSVNVSIPNDLIVYGTINTPSDFSIKENITHLPPSLSDKIMELKPVKYNYKEVPEKTHYGFIAQELEDVFPELVNEVSLTEEGATLKTINYLELIPLLLLKIQDMQKDIDLLKKNNLSL